MNNKDQQNVLSNITVAYIEDEELARLELSKFLKRRVGRLIVGEDGEEGLDIIDRYRPDIVITDLKMPGMTGLEMIREAKNNGYNGGVIISSAMSDSDTILEAMDIGAVKYIVKPIDTQKLLESMIEIGSELLSKKTGKIIIDKKYLLDREEKKELEDSIKSKIAYFIKKYSGKGPKNIKVFIQGNSIRVEAEEVLTTLEQSIICNDDNYSLVDYNRKLFYLENKSDIESIVKESIDSKIELTEIEPNSKKNMDFLNFLYE